MFKYLAPFLLLFISASAFAKKAVCAYERAQLKNIQSAMRSIYNSQNIIDEEQRRYAVYQNCKENHKNTRNSRHKSSNKQGKSIAKHTNRDKIKKSFNQPATGRANSISRHNGGRSIRSTQTSPREIRKKVLKQDIKEN